MRAVCVASRISVADASLRSDRGTVFFYRFCTDLVADLLIPPLTSHLMSIDVWMPLLGAVISVGLATVMLLAFPETLPIRALFQQQSNGAANTSGEEGGGKPSWFTAKGWTSGIRALKENFGFITSHAALGSLVLTFLISKVGRQSTNILFQYVSKRYGWTLAQVSTPQPSRSRETRLTSPSGRSPHLSTRSRQHRNVRSDPARSDHLRAHEMGSGVPRPLARQGQHSSPGLGHIYRVSIVNAGDYDPR